MEYRVIDESMNEGRSLQCDICRSYVNKLANLYGVSDEQDTSSSIHLCAPCLYKMEGAVQSHRIPSPEEQARKLWEESKKLLEKAETLRPNIAFCDRCKAPLSDGKATVLWGKILCKACALKEIESI